MQGRLTLQRRDAQTAVLDDLIYEYNTGTNRLRNTNTADGENYTYDQIGNLISDAEEDIDSIAWAPYGKVRKVEKADNSSVSFRYDASGNRIAKIAGSDTTVYVRDASGNVMGIYKNDTLIEQSIYGSSRLGLMTSSSKTGYRTLGGKKYELSNHLGNVLAVVSDNINFDQDSTWATVVNMTDYYPFGLAMEGRSLQDSSYRYGFNGKEEDSNGEWGSQNHYDYRFRIYNPSIAKFLSVDPLAIDYPWYTPYQYAGNSPIANIDVDGLEDQLAIDGTIVSGPINMEKYNNAILQKRVESERQVMGLKPFSRRVDINQSFIGPNNNPLSFEESQRLNRKYEAESNFNRLSSDISTISPFAGGGSENNPFGFASTLATTSEEVPMLLIQEYAIFKIAKYLKKPIESYRSFTKSTVGVYKNTDGIHHSTLRSRGYNLYKSNTLNHNQNIEKGADIFGNVWDTKGMSDKIKSGIDNNINDQVPLVSTDNKLKDE